MLLRLGLRKGWYVMNENDPEIIEILELMDSVEIIYKETSNVMYAIYPPPPPEQRVYKIVYSCVDGKWNKSEPIPGEIVRATEETYDFE